MEKKEISISERLAQMKAASDARTIRYDASVKRMEQFLDEGQRKFDQHDRDMLDIAQGKKPKESKSAVPDLQQRMAATRARIERSEELERSQERLLDELAANPIEKQVDAVFADIGKKFYALEQEDIEGASEADRFLQADEQSDKADEELERSGQPPPLRRVK